MTLSQALRERTNVLLLILFAIFAAVACSCTAAEIASTTATIGAVSAAAAAMLDVAAPLMSPEDFAQFREGVNTLDGGVQATKSVLSAVVDAFETFRDGVNTKNAQVAQTITEHTQSIASNVQALDSKTGTGEVAAWSATGGTGGTVVSRIMSMLKHGSKES